MSDVAPVPFAGPAHPLSEAGFASAVERLEVDAASVWALIAVETNGFGYLGDRRPKILFERHVFHWRTGGRFEDHPEICSPQRGGYLGGAAEYERLARAILLDRTAALESAAWGLPQLMGHHAMRLGYVGVEDMVGRFGEGEDEQLDGAVRFLTANRALWGALRSRDWANVAYHYNGAAFAEHAYHTRLEQAYADCSEGKVPDLAIRGAQARLTYLGYDPGIVDGRMGPRTRRAIAAFQEAVGLRVTGEIDPVTDDRLRGAAKA
jgi:hypothetical protein